MKIRSSVSADRLRSALFRGTAIAGFGALILVVSGGFFPQSYLSRWGLLLWVVGFALIASGLIPYKKYVRLNAKPNEIIFDEQGGFHYFSQGELLFSASIDNVKSVEYKQVKRNYGIHLTLNRAKGNSSIFLPYFSKRSFEKIRDIVDQNRFFN